MDKKAEVSQVFVYLFSIIIISFAGFLVVKFVGVFYGDVESRTNIEFFDQVSNSYQNVATEWNSETIQEFKVTGDTEFVCFVENPSDISSLEADTQTLNTIYEGGDNIGLFSSKDNLIQSGSIGDFNSERGSFCITPQNNRIELYIENSRNDVFISNN